MIFTKHYAPYGATHSLQVYAHAISVTSPADSDSNLFRNQSFEYAFISPHSGPAFSETGRFKPFGASDEGAECGSCDAHSVRVGVLRTPVMRVWTPITASRTRGSPRHVTRDRDRFPLEFR